MFRLETGLSQGAAPQARARIEGEGEHRLVPHSRTRVHRMLTLEPLGACARRLRGPLMGGRSARRGARRASERTNERTKKEYRNQYGA